MASRVQPINLTDFRGGLNLRADAFALAPNESPDMMNVDVDPRGGFQTRKGWDRWNTADVHATWNPRSLYVHELSDGTDVVWLANNSKISRSTSGAFTIQQAAGTDIVASAAPHGADFAPWGDTLYVACGRANQACQVTSAFVGSRLTAGGAASWSPVATPTTGVMPQADFIAAHLGYMFVASTVEDGNTFRTRVRWSHPNQPTAWVSTDFLDFNEGGGPITGLASMSDHILVFKQSQVWAIYGYDSDTWQVVNVSRNLGAVSAQAIAVAENTVYFYSHLEGIYAIQDGQAPVEVSLAIRPAFTDGAFNTSAEDEVWLGWIGQRLWFACPYYGPTAASTARSVFVYDPSLSEAGSWSLYRGSDLYGVGPFAEGGFGGGAGKKLACSRGFSKDIMLLESSDLAGDLFGGALVEFDAYYTTNWVHGGTPTLKKSWRRPDLVVKEKDLGYTLSIDAYKDYDESSAVRTKQVSVAGGGSGALWGFFTWGDGTLWGPAAKGSTIEKGGSFGSARSLQLRIRGLDPTRPWGVDAIVLKLIPRRMR